MGWIIVLGVVLVVVAWRKRRKVMPSHKLPVPVGWVRSSRESGRGLRGERL